jgi:hypothetical protein
LGRRLGPLGWGSGTATRMHAHAYRRPRWRPLGMVMVTTSMPSRSTSRCLGLGASPRCWNGPFTAWQALRVWCYPCAWPGASHHAMRRPRVGASRSRVRAVRVACWARVQLCRVVVCVCVSHLQILHFLRYHLSYHPPAPLPRAHTPRPLPRASRGSPTAQSTKTPIQVPPAASSRSHR